MTLGTEMRSLGESVDNVVAAIKAIADNLGVDLDAVFAPPVADTGAAPEPDSTPAPETATDVEADERETRA